MITQGWRLAFPDAPMIAVQRHPLDILVSVMAHDLTHGFYCGYRLPDAARVPCSKCSSTPTSHSLQRIIKWFESRYRTR